VSFEAITLCVTYQRVFIIIIIIVIIIVYFVIDSIRKLLDTPSYFVTPSFPIENTHYPSQGIFLLNLRLSLIKKAEI
jgi:hypothetical protein